MSETTKNIRFSYDFRDYERKANAFIKETLDGTDDSLKYAANVFANKAQEGTYPNCGSKKIDKGFYFRKHVNLLSLVRGELKDKGYYASKEDLDALRAGYKYKVFTVSEASAKIGKRVYAYCKTDSDLKEAKKIKTRGLARVNWGRSLDTIGAKVPTSIQRLMKKGALLDSLDFNDVRLGQDNDTHFVSIKNEAKGIDSAGRRAEAYATDVTVKALMFRLSAIANKKKEL